MCHALCYKKGEDRKTDGSFVLPKLSVLQRENRVIKKCSLIRALTMESKESSSGEKKRKQRLAKRLVKAHSCVYRVFVVAVVVVRQCHKFPK